MKKLLKIFGILVISLAFIMPYGFAEEEIVKPGVTPDSPLYGFDKMFDRMILRIQTTDEARVQWSLKVAEERLSETEEMIENEDFESAELSQERHRIQMENANKYANNIEDAEKFARVQERIQEHARKVELVKNRISSTNQNAIQIMEKIQLKATEMEQKFEDLKAKINANQGGNQ